MQNILNRSAAKNGNPDPPQYAKPFEITIKEKAEDSVKDAALIVVAQKVEHYEIAGYGSVRNFAKLLGMEEVADTLQETLDEEGATDKKLTHMSRNVNVEANELASRA